MHTDKPAYTSFCYLFPIWWTLCCKAYVKWVVSSEKLPSNMHKMYRFRSSCAYSKYHLGLCSPFIHSAVSIILLVDSKGPLQTAWMGRLIRPFTVHICLKTGFRTAQPNTVEPLLGSHPGNGQFWLLKGGGCLAEVLIHGQFCDNIAQMVGC